MDSKKVIETLIKIARQQQQIIQKLAQQQGVPAGSLPNSTIEFGGGHSPAPNAATPPNALRPNQPDLHEGKTLIAALQKAGVKFNPQLVRVTPTEVHVRFEQGQDTDANWKAFMAVVQATLPGKTVTTV